MDSLTPAERSRQMATVKSKNTKPELIVRKLVFSLGYRYRLHAKRLPGKPDIFFTGRKKAIFVHGCFWHRHPKCHLARLPKSKLDFWLPKLDGNKKRDKIKIKSLMELGWQPLIIWECELKDISSLSKRIKLFMR